MLMEGVRPLGALILKIFCGLLIVNLTHCEVDEAISSQSINHSVAQLSSTDFKQIMFLFESVDDIDGVFDSIQKIEFDTTDFLTASRIQYIHASYYFKTGQMDECLEIATELSKRKSVATEIDPLIYRLLAILSHSNGDPKQGLDYTLKALHYDSILHDTAGLIKDFKNKSSFCHFLGDYKSSLNAQLKACELWNQYADSATITNPIFEIAPIYMELGDFVNAKRYIKKSIESSQTKADEHIAWINFGRYFEYQEQFKEADSLYFHLYKTSDFRSDSNALVILLNNIAYNSRNLGRMDTAFKYLDKSISVRDKLEKSETSRKLKELELERTDLKKDLRLSRLENEAEQSRVNFIIMLAFFILFIVGGTLIGITMRTKIRAQRQINEAQKRNAEKEREVAAMHASLEAIDHERSRIAMDLHDGIGMHASLARLRLSQIESDNMSADEQSIIDELNGTLGEIAVDTKRITNDLMPSSLGNLGLEFAIEEIAERMNELNDVEVKFEAENIQPLEPNKTRVIFRIAQELLNNGVKHSKGTEISLKMKMDNSGLHISYLDNGQGIDSSALNSKGKGHGLKILKSRVEHLSGEIDIASNHGTQINVKIPLENAG